MIQFPQQNARRDRNSRPFAARIEQRCADCGEASDTLRPVRTSTETLFICAGCRAENRKNGVISAVCDDIEYGFRPDDSQYARLPARFHKQAPYKGDTSPRRRDR